jgi:hypothetical protein
MAEPLLPAEPVLPAAYASPAPAASGAGLVLTVASAALFAGAALTAAARRQGQTAVAEPDLEAAENAATVAMLFGSGKKATPKSGAARKPLPKKAAAPKRKPAPKKVAPKRAVGTGGKKSTLMGGAQKTPSVENFAKNLISEENWAFQAFNILRDLPKNNERKKSTIEKM